jgi:alpha-L-fucosidase
MKKTLFILAAALLAGIGCASLHRDFAWDRAVADPAAAKLARPSAVQYAWHEQERLMFICLDPCTWQSREYDNHTTKLGDMKLEKLEVEQWMAAAETWGAQEIMLVCKHTGGFCWWPTTTTDYSVKNIPWKNGQGNLVKEVADACRKHGFKVGVYIYSDDPKYMAGIGRGGKTDDPDRQAEWSAKLRQQWKEVLGIYGKDLVREIWFDGSCIVPLKDIIDDMAPNAVIMNSEWASIRWTGNEEAIATDPNWNTLNSKDLKGGVSTDVHNNPDGDAWAPVEADTTVYDHNWFWSPGGEGRRKSLDNLLSRYVLSIGRGSVFLLNSNPNTDGLIPEADLKLYRDLNRAIDDNFGWPLATIEKVSGSEVIFPLGAIRAINCVDIWEDYRYGHRIREYQVDAWVDNRWRLVAEGTAVGRRKMDIFDEVTTDKLRIRVTKQVGTPLFRQAVAHKVTPALAASLAQRPSLVRQASVTASSIFSDPYAAKYIIDGNKGTRWGSANEDKLAWLEFDLQRPRRFAGMTASELADRIRGYAVEVRNQPDAPWKTIFTGERVGGNLKVDLPAVTARHVRFRIANLENGPAAATIWEMDFFDRPEAWEEAATLDLKAGGQQLDIDLSAQVTDPGQYEIRLEGASIANIKPLFEGKPGEARFLEKIAANTWRLNRSQAVAEGSASGLRVTIQAAQSGKLNVLIRPR